MLIDPWKTIILKLIFLSILELNGIDERPYSSSRFYLSILVSILALDFEDVPSIGLFRSTVVHNCSNWSKLVHFGPS